MNPATNLLHGLIIQVLWVIHLLDDAVLHNDDSGTQCHGLCLVMGNVDNGGLQSLVKLGNLNTHLASQLCIQVGQRLVHQEYLGGCGQWRVPWQHAVSGRRKEPSAYGPADAPGQESWLRHALSCQFHPSVSFLSFRPKAMLSYTDICGYRA